MNFSILLFRSLTLSEIIPEALLRGRPPSLSDSAGSSDTSSSKRTQHLSETSDGGSTDSSSGCCDYFTEECDVLQEMFPDSSFLEVRILSDRFLGMVINNVM